MNKLIQYLVFFFLIIITVIALYLFDSAPSSYRFHKLFYQKSYRGVVNEIYIDTKNHGNKTIVCIDLCKTNKTFKIRTPDGNQKIYGVINYGDTIIKHSNTDFLIVNGIKADTLNYRLKFPE